MNIKTSCADCFGGLSCQPRIIIIDLLKKNGPMSVMKIAKHFKMTQPTITYHLNYLKKVGLIKSKKKGRNVFYSISLKCGVNVCNLLQ